MMSGLWVFPVLVLLAILIMAAILVCVAIKRSFCRHEDVRSIRQQNGDQFYMADVCMKCGNAGKVKS